MQTITVRDRQSLLDLSVQYCGDVQNVFDIALTNELSITETEILDTGMQLQIPPSLNKAVAEYFRTGYYFPATAEVVENTADGGIEFWAVEVDFFVS